MQNIEPNPELITDSLFKILYTDRNEIMSV